MASPWEYRPNTTNTRINVYNSGYHPPSSRTHPLGFLFPLFFRFISGTKHDLYFHCILRAAAAVRSQEEKPRDPNCFPSSLLFACFLRRHTSPIDWFTVSVPRLRRRIQEEKSVDAACFPPSFLFVCLLRRHANCFFGITISIDNIKVRNKYNNSHINTN